MNAARLAAVLAAVALPSTSRAHEISHQVERRGAAFAVRARYDGGEPLAGATYQVLPPGVPDRIEREGRTDAEGWVEFVPDVPGGWRIRIVDGAATVAPAAPSPERKSERKSDFVSTILRPAAVALAIGFAFAWLREFRRRRAGR
jgi:nickel transport protein